MILRPRGIDPAELPWKRGSFPCLRRRRAGTLLGKVSLICVFFFSERRAFIFDKLHAKGVFRMKSSRLRTIIFLALCCDLGLFAKKVIGPFANVITDSLHIPGGIGTSFSLMFLVVAAVLVPRFGCATVMGAVQSGLALALGMVGSMGALSPIGYIVPGIAIDLVLALSGKLKLPRTSRMVLANAIAAPCAALTANLIVFRLGGIVLALYVSVAASSGLVCGFLGAALAKKLIPIIGAQRNKEDSHHEEKTVFARGSGSRSFADSRAGSGPLNEQRADAAGSTGCCIP